MKTTNKRGSSTETNPRKKRRVLESESDHEPQSESNHEPSSESDHEPQSESNHEPSSESDRDIDITEVQNPANRKVIIDSWLKNVHPARAARARHVAGKVFSVMFRVPNSSEILCSKLPFRDKCVLMEKLQILSKCEYGTPDFFAVKHSIASVLDSYAKLTENDEELEQIEKQGDVLNNMIEGDPLKLKIFKAPVSEHNKKIILSKYANWINMPYDDGEKAKLQEWIETAIKIVDGGQGIPITLAAGRPAINKYLYEVKSYMDKHLYGMTGPKERLLELVASRITNPDSKELSIGLLGPPGVGKCLHPDTKLLLYFGGTKKACDVAQKDILFGDDGMPRVVLSTCRGTEQMYKITTPIYEFIVNEPHVMTFMDVSDNRIADIPLNEFLEYGEEFKGNQRLFTIPVEYAEVPTKNDPFMLGVLLASGAQLDTVEEALKYYLSQKLDYIENYISKIKPKEEMVVNNIDTSEILRVVNDCVIPESYIYNSREVRLAFLRGYVEACARKQSSVRRTASTGRGFGSALDRFGQVIHSPNRRSNSASSRSSVGSRRGSAVGSRSSSRGSVATSKSGSSATSKTSSTATSRTGSKTGSKAGSRTSSKTKNTAKTSKMSISTKGTKPTSSSKLRYKSQRVASVSPTRTAKPAARCFKGSIVDKWGELSQKLESAKKSRSGRSRTTKDITRSTVDTAAGLAAPSLAASINLTESARKHGGLSVMEPSTVSSVIPYTSLIIEPLKFIIGSLGYRYCVSDEYIIIYGDINKLPSIHTYIPYKFEITKLGVGEYCGFTLDKNGRFLLESCMVSHNTHLAEVFASAVKLPYAKINMGGSTDPSYFLGSSYTYIGSQPGVISNALCSMKSNKGIIYFDEFDKIYEHADQGMNKVANLFLHISDPLQQGEFRDDYLAELKIDISGITFIYSFNDKAAINPVLLNRIPMIEIADYSDRDKLVICKNYIIPNLLDNVGLCRDTVIFTDEAIQHAITCTSGTDKKGIRTVKHILNDLIKKINLYIASYDPSGKLALSYRVQNFTIPYHVIPSSFRDFGVQFDTLDAAVYSMYM